MNEQQFKEINKKIDTIVRLMILNLIQDKEFKEQVRILSFSGFQPKEIAGFLRKTPNAIRIALTRLRKEKKRSME